MRSLFVNEKRWFDGLALLFCLVAVAYGIRATHDLDWPFDADLIRDVGHAESVASGELFADPQFRDEGQWYNPLVPSVVGALSRVSGWEVGLLYARLGAYVNGFGALAFYVLLVVLFGRRTALPGLVAYLFLDPAGAPVPYAATYTPWLYSLYGTQALFYAGLASLAIALRKDSTGWHLASGALLGMTFLGHTFPAVLLGLLLLGSAIAGAVSRRREGGTPRKPLLRFGGAIAVAFAFALPFLATILFRYRLQVVNPAPTAWIYPPMRDLGGYLARFAGWSVVLSGLGLVSLLRGRSSEPFRVGAKLILGWAAIVAAWLAYVAWWWWAKENGQQPPAVTFSMHVNFYFGVLLAVLFGVGSAALVERLARGSRAGAGLILISSIVLALVHLPGYAQRSYFAESRELSQRLENQVRGFGAFEWIRDNTAPDEVFLSSDHHAMFTVLAAGRKIVATFAMHSNPYVDVKQRRRDRKRMFEALGRGRWKEFFDLCERYDVGYVIMNGEVPSLRRAPPRAFTVVLASKFGVIARVRRPDF